MKSNKSSKTATTPKSTRSVVSGRSTQTLEDKLLESPKVGTTRAVLPEAIPVPDQPQNAWQRSLVGAGPAPEKPEDSNEPGPGAGGGGMDASAWDVAQTLQWLE